jgi:DNA-binding HxlR family transcriptional regulator
MARYGQFCPVAVTCEVVTERWTPLVVRELLAGSRRFNDLRRGLPRVSPSLLARRLRALEHAGIVEREDGPDGVRYDLTEAGEALRPVIDALAGWGMAWGQGLLDPENLDADLLMWDMRRSVVADALDRDRDRVVVELRLAGASTGRTRYWLVLDRVAGAADLCLADPGFDVDLVVEGHVRTMIAYWLGRDEIADAVRRGALTVTGSRELVRAFPGWFRRSSDA